VTVKYFAYARTAQETCLRLMGRKLLVAMGMEGKFSAEGLQAVGDDDLLMAMARELVTVKGIGESAEFVWKSIQEQNAAIGHAESSPTESFAEVEAPPDNEVIVPAQEPLPAVIDQLLLFGASLSAASGRKRARRRLSAQLSPVDQQLGLF
jgi:hypothetical protein